MTIIQLNPYLNFNGDAGKAIKLYEKALGAKTESLQRFGDMAPKDTPPALHDNVIHAVLRIGNSVVMISDGRPGEPVPAGGSAHVCLAYDDVEEMRRAFDALSVGGTVTMALADTFWGAVFGTLTDAHGIQWMFNCEKKKG
ncbi:MAG: glyoxalase/bleomycin resistance/extradiol dioxygenase family protein [Myxococcota bacterium]